MVSIEAYRAAIGRHNNRCKHTNKGYLPLFNGYEIYFILIACFLISFLPVALYLMFLTFICITIDLISYRLTKYLQINNRDTFLNNLDTQCNNFSKGDYVLDLTSCRLAKYLQNILQNICRDTFWNNLDTQCNNFLKGDCVHPVNSKKIWSLTRYLCLVLLLLSCIAFISHSVPTTVNSEGYLQTSNNMLKNLELYNLSFLKLTQLIVDGDVESNPGPVNNVDNTPTKGRPMKKGFRGTPKKQKFEKVENVDVDFNICYNIPNSNAPLGLLNHGENVCFFNSVLQVLYSLPMFRQFVHELPTNTVEVSAIRSPFSEISNSNVAVRTSTCVQKLRLHDYRFGMQYDAHDSLIQLLEKIYPVIVDDCMFKVTTLESTVCQSCNHTIDKQETCNHLSLHLEDTSSLQTISGILRTVMDPHGMPLLNYRCDTFCWFVYQSILYNKFIRCPYYPTNNF